MPINETFYGFVESTTDALLLFEACQRGVLPKISRRLQEKERGIIRSGSIFVFDEKESGIKRWTDGRVWSPSRILGNFLIYRELDGRETLHQRQQYNAPYYVPRSSNELLADYLHQEEKIKDRNLLGSLSDTYKFLRNGLIKKTISIQIDGRSQHMVSYYSKSDVLTGRLSTPSASSELSSLEISPELILGQSFRVPPSVEFAESILKGSPPSSTSSTSSTFKRIPELPSPQYSGYEEHSYRDHYRRLDTRKSFDTNEFSMPPLSSVTESIPNYYQARERNKYYTTSTNQPPYNDKELNNREFPNLEVMTENSVYRKPYTPSLPSPSSLIWPTEKEKQVYYETKPNLIDTLNKYNLPSNQNRSFF